MESSNPLAELVQLLRKGAGTVDCCGVDLSMRSQAAALLEAYIEKEMDLLVNKLNILETLFLSMHDPAEVSRYVFQMLLTISSRKEMSLKIFAERPRILPELQYYITTPGRYAYKSPNEISLAKQLLEHLTGVAEANNIETPPLAENEKANGLQPVPVFGKNGMCGSPALGVNNAQLAEHGVRG